MKKRNWCVGLLAIIFIIGICYRLTALFPLPIGNDSKTNALQSYYVLKGAFPIFYPGQAWMGTAGIYLLALLYKVMGISSLTLGLYAWGMSCLFFFFSGLLALRLFGLETAILTALLFMIPNHELMEWTSQVRPDYEMMFFLAPLILMMTYSVVIRFKKGKQVSWQIFWLAFISGVGFWTNMGTGPAVISSLIIVVFYLRKVFFRRQIFYYGLGGMIGFFPVIYYNIFYDFVFFKQSSSFSNLAPHKLIKVMYHFFTNAFPFFWGIRLSKLNGLVLKGVFFLVLVWVLFLFGLAFRQGFLRWKHKKNTVGLQIIFLYFFLHMFVASASAFGNRFSHGSSPIPYITVLYSVAFVIPAVAIHYLKSAKYKLLFFIPMVFFIGNNLVNTFEYPKQFANLLQQGKGWGVLNYPIANHPYAQFIQEHGIKNGYGGSGAVNDFRLITLGKATISDFFQEDYVDTALKVDSAKDIFWLSPPFNKNLDLIGCSFKTETVAGQNMAFDFSKKRFLEQEVSVKQVDTSKNKIARQFLVDRNISTTWDIFPGKMNEQRVIDFTFDSTKKLSKIVIVPKNYFYGPKHFFVEVSRDGISWEKVYSVDSVLPVFWSVYHPYLKVVKSRLEIVLPKSVSANYCRLTILIDKEDTETVSISEIYFYGTLEKIEDTAFEDEVDKIILQVTKNYFDSLILADHWFSNYFKRIGLNVEFISNRFVNDCGKKNKFDSLKRPYIHSAVAKETKTCVIARKANTSSIKRILEKDDVPFTITKFMFFDLFDVDMPRSQKDFYWNGFDLNEILTEERKVPFFYPPLGSIFKGTRPCQYTFSDNFKLTGYYLGYLKDEKTINISFEISNLSETEKVFYLFVHFLDDAGNILFQGDIKMDSVEGKTNAWKTQSRVLLSRDVSIPSFVKGSVKVKVGIWCPETGKRLAVEENNNDAVIIDSITL